MRRNEKLWTKHWQDLTKEREAKQWRLPCLKALSPQPEIVILALEQGSEKLWTKLIEKLWTRQWETLNKAHWKTLSKAMRSFRTRQLEALEQDYEKL